MGTVAYESFSLQSLITKVDVSRAGRMREWSQGELRLYWDRLCMLKGRSSFHQWLVSSQRRTQTSQQSCWSSRQKWTSRPCEKHSWSVPIYRIRYLRAGHKWKNSSSARANTYTLPCLRVLLLSMGGIPSFFVRYSFFVRSFTLLHTKWWYVSQSASW